MDSTLQDKVALVTGGGSGIGLAAAERLVDEGAFVYLSGVGADQLDDAARRLGPRTRPLVADVSVRAEMERVATTIAADHGSLDVVFANAGIGSYMALSDITEQHFQRTFDVNVKGVLFTVQSVLPILAEGASIIINTSVTADLGLPDFSVYAASKAAVRSFVHSWATDLSSRRIRVNAVSPGVIPTGAATGELGRSPDEERQHQQRVSEYVPLGRVGTATEIGRAVAFLAGDDSSYVNGVELTVDGGMTSVFAGRLK